MNPIPFYVWRPRAVGNRGAICNSSRALNVNKKPDRPDGNQETPLGILGVAKINDRMLPSFVRARNLELYGIASRSLDRALAAAEAAGIPKAYGSYEQLLDDPAIDVVYNPLRTICTRSGRARRRTAASMCCAKSR